MDFWGLFVIVNSLNFCQCNHEEEVKIPRSRMLRTEPFFTLPPLPFIVRRTGPTLSPIPETSRDRRQFFLPNPRYPWQDLEHKRNAIHLHHHLNEHPDLHGVSVSPYHYHHRPTGVGGQSSYTRRPVITIGTTTVLNAHESKEHSDTPGHHDHHLNGHSDLHGVSVSPYHYHYRPTGIGGQSSYTKRPVITTRTTTVLNVHESKEYSDTSGKSGQHKQSSSQLKKLHPTYNITGKHLGQVNGASGRSVGSVIQVNVMLSLLLMCKLVF